MKQMARRPVAWLPDDHFLYADDLTRLRAGEVARLIVGGFIGMLVMWAVAFGVSVL